MVSKNYLITGGLGLIGSNLANTLEGNITIVTRTNRHIERIKRTDVRILIKPVQKLQPSDLKHIDCIYHCASTVDNYHVLDDPYLDVETNINGTIHLLELIRRLHKKPKLIYLSTFFVYGNMYDKLKKPITEESPTDPLAIYPASKLCTESIIKLYARLYRIPYLICRFTNVYGEEEDYANKKKGALNYLIMQAVRGETLRVYKGGNFVRDYIHVDDAVSALIFLDSKNTDDVYLVGYGEPVRFKDMIAYILRITGNKSTVNTIQSPFFHTVVGITNFVADTGKIRSLGWMPRIDYKAGIQRVVEKYRAIQ